MLGAVGPWIRIKMWSKDTVHKVFILWWEKQSRHTNMTWVAYESDIEGHGNTLMEALVKLSNYFTELIIKEYVL